MSLARQLEDDTGWSPVTTVAFDRRLDAQRDDTRWELIAGDPVAVAPPLIAHALMVDNLGRKLAMHLPGRPCRVFRGTVGVQSGDDDRRTDRPIPDILVHCGPLDQRRRFVTDPTAIIEVLSPNTMDDDRGAKLAFYKTLPSLRHIVLLYQDALRVEHYWRPDDAWAVEVLAAATESLALAALDFALPLAAIYEDVAIGA